MPRRVFFSRTSELIGRRNRKRIGGRYLRSINSKISSRVTDATRRDTLVNRRTISMRGRPSGRDRVGGTEKRSRRNGGNGETDERKVTGKGEEKIEENLGEDDRAGGPTERDGRRLIRAPFMGNLCTRSIKPVCRACLSDRKASKLPANPQTFLSFHPPISLFSSHPPSPPSQEVFFSLFSSMSLSLLSSLPLTSLPLMRYNSGGYCTPSRIMMLKTE